MQNCFADHVHIDHKTSVWCQSSSLSYLFSENNHKQMNIIGRLPEKHVTHWLAAACLTDCLAVQQPCSIRRVHSVFCPFVLWWLNGHCCDNQFMEAHRTQNIIKIGSLIQSNNKTKTWHFTCVYTAVQHLGTAADAWHDVLVIAIGYHVTDFLW